jgi:HlyD family secretion protein
MTTQQLPELWKDKRLLGALLGLLLLGTGGAVFWNVRSQEKAAEQAEAAKPLPAQVKVAALGRVEPTGGVIDVAASESGIIREMLVKVGDRVNKGETMAYLDVYAVRKAERDYAQSQLAEAQETLAAQVQLGNARVQEAGTRIDQVNQPEEESVRAQEAEIRDLQAQLNLANIELSRFERLAAEGAVAQQELDSQTATVNQLEQQITAARATREQLASARNANLNNATAQVSSAEADLQLSQANAGVQSAARNLALAEARLDQSILRAPSDGQIIEIFVEPGESTSSESGSQAILSIGNTRAMQVVAEVYETDVGLVKPGQSATISSRNGAFEETLTGTVNEVALQIFKNDVLADDPAANADARVVEVEITVDQPEVIQSLTNLQVDVVIDIENSGSNSSSSAAPLTNSSAIKTSVIDASIASSLSTNASNTPSNTPSREEFQKALGNIVGEPEQPAEQPEAR